MRRYCLTIVSLLLLTACGQRDPVEEIQQTLASAPDYTVILEDMRAEGAFFPQYYHKYRIVQGERTVQTDWIEVSESIYRKYEPYLGMALASKTAEGGVADEPHPPGYHYVGNPTYGYWGGGGFWVWYGQYAMMRSLLGGGMGRRISRDEYTDYRRTRQSGRPYFGKDRDYGTNGSLTKQTKPRFFERRQRALQRSRSSFSQRAQSRFGRSRTGFGSRRGGFGK